MRVTPRREATIRAALRHWQRLNPGAGIRESENDPPEMDIATNAGNYTPMNSAEIDAMLEEMEETWPNDGHTQPALREKVEARVFEQWGLPYEDGAPQILIDRHPAFQFTREPEGIVAWVQVKIRVDGMEDLDG